MVARRTDQERAREEGGGEGEVGKGRREPEEEEGGEEDGLEGVREGARVEEEHWPRGCQTQQCRARVAAACSREAQDRKVEQEGEQEHPASGSEEEGAGREGDTEDAAGGLRDVVGERGEERGQDA